MRIQVLSDLHVEFAPFLPAAQGQGAADLVVLAGDIGIGKQGLCWARSVFPDERLVYVSGNHELYGGDWFRTLDTMRESARTLDIDFLENDQMEIDDVRILGCALWVNFDYFGIENRNIQMRDYERGLSDCWSITVGEKDPGFNCEKRKLTADDVWERHKSSCAWLTQALSVPHPKTIVVTHHAPNPKSVASRYVADDLTPGFVSNLPDELVTAADLWIHGHMHDSADYVVAGANGKATRVVCNPRGYPQRNGAFENDHFNSELILEI